MNDTTNSNSATAPKPAAKSKTIFDIDIAVVGEPATGKSAIISRVSGGTFPPFYKPTNGVDQSVATIELEDGVEASIHFWDVSGHERFGTTTRTYYSKCSGFIFVFDRTRDITLSSLLNWNMDINSRAANNIYDGVMEEDIVKILIANKSDLVDASHINHKQEADISSFSETCNIIERYNCSAKTGMGIDEAIRTLAKKIVENLKKKGVAGRTKSPQQTGKVEKPKSKQQQQQDLGPVPIFQTWKF